MQEPLTPEQSAQLEMILAKLQRILAKLSEVNRQSGNLGRYEAMKREIEELGWGRICEKYHPDINVDDPAAMELFALYKFIYDTMR